jgi:hypothetical protein
MRRCGAPPWADLRACNVSGGTSSCFSEPLNSQSDLRARSGSDDVGQQILWTLVDANGGGTFLRKWLDGALAREDDRPLFRLASCSGVG